MKNHGKMVFSYLKSPPPKLKFACQQKELHYISLQSRKEFFFCFLLSSAHPFPQQSCFVVKIHSFQQHPNPKRAGLGLDHRKDLENQKEHFEGRVIV